MNNGYFPVACPFHDGVFSDPTDGSANTCDLSLCKNIPLGEHAKLQFRAEAFNIFNRVEFVLPNTAIGLPAAGSIASQENQPRDIQFALKAFL